MNVDASHYTTPNVLDPHMKIVPSKERETAEEGRKKKEVFL